MKFGPTSKSVKKVWGYEQLLHNEDFCAKIMTIDQGAECSIHCHADKKEMFILIKGAIRVELWPSLWGKYGCNFEASIDLYSAEAYGLDLLNPEVVVILGQPTTITYIGDEVFDHHRPRVFDNVYIDKYIPHRFIGLEATNTFIEASTYDDPNDSYRFTKSRRPGV